MNPKVDAFLKKAKKWGEEMKQLRAIGLDCGLTEELKWGKPCYTFENHNVALLLPLKEHCVLLLPKGALLKDPEGILVIPGENTQAARQIRFTSLQEIVKRQAVLKAYLLEAIAAEKAGLQIEYKKEHPIPDELRDEFAGNPKLKAAFSALTPGRQRGYIMHISAAKQSKTRISRIEKCTPRILDGKGMNDE